MSTCDREGGPLWEVASGAGAGSGGRVLQAKGALMGGSLVHSRNRQKAKWLEMKVRGS